MDLDIFHNVYNHDTNLKLYMYISESTKIRHTLYLLCFTFNVILRLKAKIIEDIRINWDFFSPVYGYQSRTYNVT